MAAVALGAVPVAASAVGFGAVTSIPLATLLLYMSMGINVGWLWTHGNQTTGAPSIGNIRVQAEITRILNAEFDAFVKADQDKIVPALNAEKKAWEEVDRRLAAARAAARAAAAAAAAAAPGPPSPRLTLSPGVLAPAAPFAAPFAAPAAAAPAAPAASPAAVPAPAAGDSPLLHPIAAADPPAASSPPVDRACDTTIYTDERAKLIDALSKRNLDVIASTWAKMLEACGDATPPPKSLVAFREAKTNEDKAQAVVDVIASLVENNTITQEKANALLAGSGGKRRRVRKSTFRRHRKH